MSNFTITRKKCTPLSQKSFLYLHLILINVGSLTGGERKKKKLDNSFTAHRSISAPSRLIPRIWIQKNALCQHFSMTVDILSCQIRFHLPSHPAFLTIKLQRHKKTQLYKCHRDQNRDYLKADTYSRRWCYPHFTFPHKWMIQTGALISECALARSSQT